MASSSLSPIESAKRAAAFAAVDAHVKPHLRHIGIGSGSTVVYVVERIVAQGEEVNASRLFVPTSFQAKNLIIEGDTCPELDVVIDGADDVDMALNLIKGGGACHLQEKVIAESSKEMIVVADHRKMSQVLGDGWTKGVPIEVAPFAAQKALGRIRQLGSTSAHVRMGVAKAGPVVTDNGNLCIDAVFPQAVMRNPDHLLRQLKLITGVVEVGLFNGLCQAAYFGMADGSVSRRSRDGSVVTLS